jgi:hypothetical protein
LSLGRLQLKLWKFNGKGRNKKVGEIRDCCCVVATKQVNRIFFPSTMRVYDDEDQCCMGPLLNINWVLAFWLFKPLLNIR